MTEPSSVIRNCAEASVSRTLPAAAAALTAAAHLGLSTYIHTASSITVTDNQAQIVPVCPRVTVTVCS